MARARCCVECLIKTGAFIGVLMSLAIFGLSTMVLISSVTPAHYSNSNQTEGSEISDSSNGDGEAPFQTTSPTPQEREPDRVVVDVIPPSTNSSDFIDVSTPSSSSSSPDNATDQALPLANDEDATESETPTSAVSEATTTITFIPSPTSSLPGGIMEERNVSESSSTTATTSPPTTTTIQPSAEADSTSAEGSENSSTFTNNTSTFLMSTSEAKPWTQFFERQQQLWENKTETYIILMQCSSGAGIFSALLQLSFSLLLICGSRKDLRDRTTLWNLSNFIVLILSIVIILLPFSYNNGTDTFKRASTFWRDLERVVMIDSLPLFSERTLEHVWNSFGNFLTKDFALYYYVVGMDFLILQPFLLPPLLYCLSLPCRKLCCKKKHYDEDTESDLMLFETGGDPFKYYNSR